ncbi:MAG: hypothetical protein ACTS6J_20660 [Burkholderiales bacterium]
MIKLPQLSIRARLDFRRRLGCDEMQRDCFSRPLAEAAFSKPVRTRDNKAALAA